jgi:hypothetical protein
MRQRIFQSWTGRVVLLAMTLLVFTTGYWVAAQQQSSPAPSTPPAIPPAAVNPGRDAKTVWVDISGFNRKNGAADKMTKLHQEMAKQGYTFIGLEVYTENGDLEGFFCSYVREP